LSPHDFLAQHQLERSAVDAIARNSLLKDQASGQAIRWATDDYQNRGGNFTFDHPILPDALFGSGDSLILPRVLKDSALKGSRTRQKAEVFTPSWVCNRQNNLVDAAWFGREGVFNVENEEGWEVNPEPITFELEGKKTWKHYVDARRMEITCGEAPYLASRYDTVSGLRIPVPQRIGMLDRKLRVVSENTNTRKDWFFYALRAVEACYGYEWQGDSLYLARENLLLTVMDAYSDRFGKTMDKIYQRQIAYRLSWNLWQMDALKGVIPGTCHEEPNDELPPIIQMAEPKNANEFGALTRPCPGCRNPARKHNGIYCLLRDWRSKVTYQFVDLLPIPSKTTAKGKQR